MTEYLEIIKSFGLGNFISLGLIAYIMAVYIPRQSKMHCAIVQRQSRNLARIEDRQECLEIVLVSKPTDPGGVYQQLLAERGKQRAERERDDPLVTFPDFDFKLPFVGKKAAAS